MYCGLTFDFSYDQENQERFADAVGLFGEEGIDPDGVCGCDGLAGSVLG